MKLLFLQLFWLSFTLIGWAELRWIQRIHRRFRQEYRLTQTFFKNAPYLTRALLWFCIGISSFAIVVVPGCLLKWNIAVVEIAYGAVLVGALITGSRALISSVSYRVHFLLQLKRPSLIVIFAVVILLLDYTRALYVGGELDGDAHFEMGQITLFAQNHLTIMDTIFGKQGVAATGYSTSILHALYASIANFLNQSAAWVWFYSNAFFTSLTYIAFFAVTSEFVKKYNKPYWTYGILAVLPLVYGNVLLYQQLHNQVVLIWVAALVIGLKMWLDSRALVVLIAASLLLATTHPLNALMAASLIGLLCVVLVFIRSISIRVVLRLLPIVILLALPMGLYFYYPHEITEAGFNDQTTDSTLHLLSVGPFFINTHHRGVTLLQLWGVVIFGYVLFARRIKNKLYKSITIVLAGISILIIGTLQLFSVVGYISMLTVARDRKEKILVILLVIFSGLVLYNPVLLTLAHGNLPEWTLSRFKDFNILGYTAPILGIVATMGFLYQSLGRIRIKTVHQYGSLFILLLAIPFVFVGVSYGSAVSMHQIGFSKSRKQALNEYSKLEPLTQSLKHQTLFSDDDLVLVRLLAINDTDLFVVDNEANANPAVHIKERKSCATTLVSSLSDQDLHASQITRIVLSPNSDEVFKNRVANSDITRKVVEYNGYAVYAVDQSKQTNGICNIPPPTAQRNVTD